MSIKKLFESTDKSKNYLTSTDKKEAFKNVESGRNVSALHEKQRTFVPQIDYSDPKNFARYGSAYLYYESSIDRIIDYYPYDGSDAEINEYYNKSLDIEKYVFNNLYPRTNGYIILCADGYGTSGAGVDGYDVPATQEHITFYGGPGTASATTNKKDLFNNPKDSKFQYSNVYDTDIYTTEGYPSNYGSGSRESNLKADFDRGVTVEFWMKSGSMAPSSETTRKQVIFDMWNNNSSASSDYGRLRIMMTGTAGAGQWLTATGDSTGADTPFYVTAISGNWVPNFSAHSSPETINGNALGGAGIYNYKIGKGLVADNEWHHYAFVIYNSGSDAKLSLYVDGKHNDLRTIANTPIYNLNSKDMVGRIGALVTAPEESNATTGSAKLNASLDEFRFWKVRRSAEEIGRNYFTQIRGGVNTDISNTTLGIYYKFNEGITGESATDSVILDYSGRVVNGAWAGYGSNSRNTGSAIIEAAASTKEYEDPIIHSNHPDVITLKSSLLYSGSYHDDQNNSALKNMVPGWILDDEDTARDTNLNKVSHIMGAYFDKLYLQIQAIPGFRNLEYTSASYAPLPFAQHLPQSLGLYTPDLFIDSDVVERFKNRDEDSVFESDLAETKNLIYLNLYNNLANIFKSKGTEKAIRNVFRCMNIDDRLVRFNTYFKNQTYTLDNTMQQTLVEKTFLNLYELDNKSGVVYQRSSSLPAEANNRHNGSGFLRGHGAQQKYGLTLEADIVFPSVYKAAPKFLRNYTTASLFGMSQVPTGATNYPAADGHTIKNGQAIYDLMTGSRTPWLATDNANFQVYAVRSPKNSNNAYFVISSSIFPYPIPTLTSSVFADVYGDESWNLSVRLKPMAVPMSGSTVHMGEAVAPGIVSGSDNYDYQLEFRGINAELGVVKNKFLLTASLGQESGSAMIVAGKRVSAGAYRFNTTGSVIHPSDVEVAGIRYWTKYIKDITLDQHAYDVYNQGISGSQFQISPLDGGPSADKHGNFENYNHNTLALSWDFNNITGSNAVGNFEVIDLSSGSADMSASYGWVGLVAGQQHPGEAYGFGTNASNVTLNRKINAFQFVDPEFAVSSDMINILSDDDKVYGIAEDVPDYFFSLEKSMYRAISDEMLTFFAGVVDFNNTIGEAVNRYRMNYKGLEKLRQIFFEKVNNIRRVEQYIEYYKWFDDAISDIVEQIVPASAKFNSDVMNIVESHILERNKYQNKYPTFEFKDDNLDTSMSSTFKRNYPYVRGSPPIPAGAELTEAELMAHDIWAQIRATGDEKLLRWLSSGVASVDDSRKLLSRIKGGASDGFFTDLSTISKALDAGDGTSLSAAYHEFGGGMPAALLAIAEVASTDPSGDAIDPGEYGTAPYSTSPQGQQQGGRWDVIHGGINFPPSKNQAFSDNALRPFGPVNQDNKVFVPLNILYSPIEDFTQFTFNKRANSVVKKTRRVIKVHHGREWEDGESSFNLKSTMAYPFNIMSSSVKSGFNKEVIEKITGAIEITNLHGDSYGPDLETPMQGTYTQKHVGGHQSRHVPLNFNAEDTYLNRPERWKILLGRCPGVSGAMGMVGPDYPYPEANAVGATPYPVTAAMNAVYYRDMVAKRPVNIKNILMSTASEGTILAGIPAHSPIGNYRHNYEVVQIGTAGQQPRKLAISHSQVIYPQVVQDLAALHSRPRGKFVSQYTVDTNVINNFLNIRHAADSHFDWDLDYAPLSTTGSTNKSIVIQKFAAPGGAEVMSRGFLDIRGGEFSVYNAIPYRNLSVLKPSQGPSGTLPDPGMSGVGNESVAGMAVSDIHLKDYGLYSHLARHTAKFGRDSLYATSSDDIPGESYDQLPGFHKTHRNSLRKLVQVTHYPFPETFQARSQHDNFFVQHPIPRSDRQYAWVTGALDVNPTAVGQSSPEDLRYYGYAPVYGLLAGQHSSSTGGYVSFFSYLTASSVTEHLVNASNAITRVTNEIQPTYPLNTFTVDPFSGSTNILGQPLGNSSPTAPPSTGDGDAGWYLNNDMITRLGVPLAKNQTLSTAHYFNLLMTRRGVSYGWDWKKTRQQDHVILLNERKNNVLSLINSTDEVPQTFKLQPLSLRGRPAMINYSDGRYNPTVRLVSDNERIYFNEPELDNITNIDLKRVKTPFQQVSKLLMKRTNWILYTQNIFPSLRNEFATNTRRRLNYDNKFWAASVAERSDIGSASGSFPSPYDASSDNALLIRDPLSASFVRRLGYNSQGVQVSQSCWPLDAPKDFLTRSSPPFAYASSADTRVAGQIRHSGSGGEFQNDYSFLVLSGGSIQFGNAENPPLPMYPQMMAVSARYSRPHLLSSPWSVVARSGIKIVETGSQASPGNSPAHSRIPGSGDQSGIPQDAGAHTADPAFQDAYQISPYGGSAAWEANTQAGIIVKTGSGESSEYIFQSASSDPWFNKYDDFEYELGLIAKDYAIVPEFRISEHVEDYIKGGLFNEGKTDWCEIVGTEPHINSSTGSFYKDYSNSEFMRDFVKVSKTARKNAREFMLVCTAAIRLNPYKGFYPAQRTLDIASQFSRSYAAGFAVKVGRGGGAPQQILQGEDLIAGAPGALRPLYQTMFAPGIMFNSIKAGMAVDYPVVLDPSKVISHYFSGAAGWGYSGSIAGNRRADVGPYRWDASQARGVSELLGGGWALTNDLSSPPGFGTDANNEAVFVPAEGYPGGTWFDKRIPFEAIIRPENYIRNVDFIDMEPHPSASYSSRFTRTTNQPLTASMVGNGDEIYTLMAQNFFGEMGNFFLKDKTYSTIQSSVVPNDLRFPSGSIYGARFKTRRSTTARIYRYDSGSGGNHEGFSDYGATAISGGLYITGAYYPIPQDPQRQCHETFTMYSRPTAFGPPIAGRPDFRIMSGTINTHGVQTVQGAYLNPHSMSMSGTMDCFNGYNWAYTPPYYHGESWADFIFRPDPAKSYDLEQILAETETIYTRVDPGPLSGINTGNAKNADGDPVIGLSPTLIVGSPNIWSNTGSYVGLSADADTRAPGTNHRPPYAGDNVNHNAMQVSASFNLFGVQRVVAESIDPESGKVVPASSAEKGKRWIIKPKFETPMFNFNDTGVHPITSGSENLTLPLYASASTPRGMWHQYGIIEPDPAKGIFMEIGDIPEQWLKYHYNVVNSASAYNNYDLIGSGSTMYENMKSLSDIVGFERAQPVARMGQLAQSQKLKEAIVIVPYTLKDRIITDAEMDAISLDKISTRKSFFTIPREMINAARKDLSVGVADSSLKAAGRSIRTLVKTMPNYVLPPWLDFLSIEDIDPIVMYMIEFEYELDRDDLAYIAQNIAPRESKKITIESQSVAHTIMDTELMGTGDILNADELRWMVFKVKQRSQSNYYDHKIPQVGEGGSKTLEIGTKKKNEYKLEYNWPYDYVSFVEMVKIDAQVLYKK